MFSALMVGIVEAMKFDAVQGQSGERFYENSITEILQEVFLLFGALICFFAAYKKQFLRPFLISTGVFLLICFFREFNNFFNNNLFRSSWQIPVYATLIPYFIYAVKHFKKIIANLAIVAETYGFGLFISGLVIVFVFSRLYGLHGIWQDLLGDNYIRDIKNISEEGIELLGYTIQFIAVIELVLLAWNNETKQITD